MNKEPWVLADLHCVPLSEADAHRAYGKISPYPFEVGTMVTCIVPFSIYEVGKQYEITSSYRSGPYVRGTTAGMHRDCQLSGYFE